MAASPLAVDMVPWESAAGRQRCTTSPIRRRPSPRSDAGSASCERPWIAQGSLSRGEAEDLVAATRRRALRLFPDKGETFDLILAPRFARLVAEFTVAPRPPARVLPFRPSPSDD
jgi:hypothetical protein